MFPLASVPTFSYKTGGRRFGAPRGNRLHAGCDLIVPLGTEIYAVANGRVIRGPYDFTTNVVALEINHFDFIVRYGEMKRGSCALRPGGLVEEGDLIGLVGKMVADSMLHFEMYSGELGLAPLTVRGKAPYQRRDDLIDPTEYLDEWAASL
jgi:murein DD-endopeptidase MepM/ murein hydrolase activator NlpD